MSLLLKSQSTQEFVQNHCQRVQRVHFRLTCIAQKCCCLNSLIPPTCHQPIYVSMLVSIGVCIVLWQVTSNRKKNKHVSTICFGLPCTNMSTPLLRIFRVIGEVGNVANQVLKLILTLGNSGVKVPVSV